MSKKVKLLVKMNGKDEISKLCDDILIRILSFLSFKEAVRSSVISRRWQHLCKYYSGCLSFKLLERPAPTYSALDLDKPKPIEVQNRFVGWVNKSLNSLQASTIDEFRVYHYMDNGFKSCVDEWVGFALQKKVKKLELNFAPDIWCYYSSLIHKNVASACYCLTKETFSSGIRSLTCLSLNFVGVSDEILEYILSSCPLLESLDVSCSAQLRHPKVSASRLKHLSLYCRVVSIQSVEIYAPNLISFEYYGDKIPLLVKCAPKLNQVYFNDNSNDLIPHLSSHLADYLPRLVTLSIGTSVVGASRNFPKLMSLKHLRCEAIPSSLITMQSLTSLIEVAPFLHKFELVVCSTVMVKKIEESELPEMWRRTREYPNKCIKEVEIVDFRAGKPHALILTYLLKNAVMLEKLVIDTRRVFIARGDYRTLSRGSHYRKKKRAKNIIDQLMRNRPGPRLVLI